MIRYPTDIPNMVTSDIADMTFKIDAHLRIQSDHPPRKMGAIGFKKSLERLFASSQSFFLTRTYA
jgi:hypothetical protein